jgi:hypothetical protein
VLEAAVALLIVGLSAMGVLTAYSAHADGARRANTRVIEAALAEDLLARIELQHARVDGALPDSLRRGRFDTPFEQFSWRAERVAVRDEWGVWELTVRVDGPASGSELRTRRFVRPVTTIAP